MHRHGFRFRLAGILWSVAVLCLTPSCGLIGDDAVDRTFTSSTESDHTHRVLITAGNIQAPQTSGANFTTTLTNDHTHTLSLTQDELRKIKSRTSFSKMTSTTDADHEHNFTFK